MRSYPGFANLYSVFNLTASDSRSDLRCESGWHVQVDGISATLEVKQNSN